MTRMLPLVFLAMSCMGPRAGEVPENLHVENLVAWCIVPFDAAKRGPEDRARMLVDLGMRRCAYDWREEHVAQFEEEILQYRTHGIEFFAFWGVHEDAWRLFKKHDLHPQIWQTLKSPPEGRQEDMVEAAAQSISGLAERTAGMECRLGLYNHGGWGGEPEHLVAVCKRLHAMGHTHVGIVYNWHHGHGHIADWSESLEIMKPYLLCVNLNGMNSGAKPKILALAGGEHDLAMLRALVHSGYAGPIGILDHQPLVDAKDALRANLQGLGELRAELEAPEPDH